MEAKLTVIAGKTSKEDIPLDLPTIIGRSRDAALTISHPMVSRKHAELFEAEGLLMIRDLGSLNGTVVGKQRVKEAPLPPETEFTIGPFTFRAQYEYSGDLNALPPAVLDDRVVPSAASAEAAAQPWSDSPDFTPTDDVPIGKTAQEPDDDFFNELFNDP